MSYIVITVLETVFQPRRSTSRERAHVCTHTHTDTGALPLPTLSCSDKSAPDTSGENVLAEPLSHRRRRPNSEPKIVSGIEPRRETNGTFNTRHPRSFKPSKTAAAKL